MTNISTKRSDSHILHIIDKEKLGGVEVFVSNLISSLSSFRYTYLFLRSSKASQKNIIRKHFSKWSFSPFFFLISFLKREKVMIVHTHHRKGFYLMCILSLFFPQVVFIHHEHGEIIQKNNTFYRMFIILFQKRISQIIAVSDVIQKAVLRQIPRVSCKVLLNPLFDFQKNEELSQKDYESLQYIQNIKRGTSFLIGYFGRLESVKQVNILLKALLLLRFSRDQWKVVLLGEGSQKKFLQRFCEEKGIYGNVFFLPPVSPSVCQKAYESLDVSVLCSKSEGLSLFLLESMQHKIPIIASDIPAPNTYISHRKNGFLFPLGNVEVLSQLLTELFFDSALRQKIGNAGYAFVRKTFPNQQEYNVCLEKIYSDFLL